MMLTAFMPLPRVVGVAKGAFYMFLSLFFASNNIMAAILLWRLITSYSCIIFSFYAFMRLLKNKQK